MTTMILVSVTGHVALADNYLPLTLSCIPPPLASTSAGLDSFPGGGKAEKANP